VFEIAGAIHSPRYCHCANCRKFSGTASAAWGLVATSELSVVREDTPPTRYDSGGGSRVFCAVCGSPLWFEPAGRAQLRGIPLGVSDAGDVPVPSMHVWTRSKVPWSSIADHAPQHETHP
jgi:hypothetical protein